MDSVLQRLSLRKIPALPCPDCNMASITTDGRFDLEASPVAALVTSNQRPSTAEIDTALAEVKHSSHELALCDDNIKHLEAHLEDLKRLETHLQDLKRKRSTISRYLLAHKAAASPIRRVPPEILAIIMLYAVSRERSLDQYFPGAPQHGMWRLALVSRIWRDVALSTPILWSEIDIDCNETRRWSDVSMFEVLLERSRPAPLTFWLIHEDIGGDNHFRVLETICAHSARWKNVFITSSFIPLKFMSRVRSAIPQLSRLKINLYNDQGLQPVIDAFSDALQLQHVDLGDLGSRSIDLPWPQLKSLKCAGTISDCLRVLPNMGALEALEFSPEVEQDSSGTRLRNQFSLPRLKSLSIPYGRFEPDFIDCLTLPALESATFVMNGSSNVTLHAYLSLIKRSSCTLTTLSLRAVRLDGSQLLALLRHHPFLHKLRLNILVDSNQLLVKEFAQALTISPTRPDPYLPRLRVLDIDMNKLSNDFLSMVESRSSAFVEDGGGATRDVVRLESLVLRSFYPSHVDYRLIHLKESDLAVDVGFAI
ncbi:hypothetical protein HGRIS_011128 [Hohenbuehelia grisea]|uniref:F-box domain-containing protein n=1 Tax=Hohenbuehelia grisea TaxID=104357 RepID=A0ABR3IZ18_9AGAR